MQARRSWVWSPVATRARIPHKKSRDLWHWGIVVTEATRYHVLLRWTVSQQPLKINFYVQLDTFLKKPLISRRTSRGEWNSSQQIVYSRLQKKPVHSSVLHDDKQQLNPISILDNSLKSSLIHSKLCLSKNRAACLHTMNAWGAVTERTWMLLRGHGGGRHDILP
jgi:hypothetical protein